MFIMQPKPGEMQSAALVAEAAHLVQVRLTKTEAWLGIEPASLPGRMSVDIDFDLERFEPFDDGRLVVEVRLGLRLGRQKRAGLGETSPEIASIRLWLVAEYKIPEGPIPEEIRREALPAFARYNGLFNCWPYFRSELQHITGMMGLPPFSLAPLIVRVAATEAAESTLGDEASRTRRRPARRRKPPAAPGE